jgi:hypothetical protein
MKSIKELTESYVELAKKHPSSKAKQEADRLGLTYYGFGRYGKDHVITHKVENEKLVAFEKYTEQGKKHKKRLDKVNSLGNKLFADAEKQPPSKDTPEQKKKMDKFWKIHDKLELKVTASRNKKNKNWDGYDEIAWDSKQGGSFKEDHKLFSKHGNEIFDDATSEEKDSLNDYTGMGYEKMNQYLWKGAETWRKETSDGIGYGDKKKLLADKEANIIRAIGNMDSLLDKSHIPKNATVYSGLSQRYKPEDFPVGKVYNYKGFLSTTLNPRTARGFTELRSIDGGSNRQRMVLELKVKKGQKGMYVGGISVHDDEYENILPRNTKLKVIGQHEINWQKPNQFITVVEAEVIQDEDEKKEQIKESNYRPFNQWVMLTEDIGKALKEPFSKASEEAKRLGLRYYGFGRYGDPKTHQITHYVDKGELIKKPTREDKVRHSVKKDQIALKDAEFKEKGLKLKSDSATHKSANNAGLTAATSKRSLDFQAEKAKHDVEKLQFKPEEDNMKRVSEIEDKVSDESTAFLKQLEAERKENDTRLNQLFDKSRFSKPQLETIQEYANEAYQAINKYLYTGYFAEKEKPEFNPNDIEIPEPDENEIEIWREDFNEEHGDKYEQNEDGEYSDDYYNHLDEYITSKKEKYEKDYLDSAEKWHYDDQDENNEFMGVATEQQLQRHIGNLDSAMDSSSAPYDFISYSGLSHRYSLSDFQKGDVYHFPAFLSTSLDHRVASGFSHDSTEYTGGGFSDTDYDGSKGVGVRPERMILKIKNKKGHKGLYVGKNGVPMEQEWLMPRDTKFKVIDNDEVLDDPEYNQVYRFINVEPITEDGDQLDLFQNTK